jgi:hypothetical protein
MLMRGVYHHLPKLRLGFFILMGIHPSQILNTPNDNFHKKDLKKVKILYNVFFLIENKNVERQQLPVTLK